MIETRGRVYLIGAGPGDPRLLTLAAVEALQRCDVVVYDYLINPAILAHARRDAALIYVGKRAGQPSITQQQINRLLIEQALAGRVVARLKGGDPFVFGRGGEEAEALAAHHLDWEVIPGISAGVAAAAYAGIPLTHRDYASSVVFLTGQERADASEPLVWRDAARLADTLVIFMCGSTIARICRELLAGGLSAQTPIAIIRRATDAGQEVYDGTIADLAACESLVFASPAIAVIGAVVALRKTLRWFGREDLQYALTPDSDAKELADIA